jgi:hypothetical protein
MTVEETGEFTDEKLHVIMVISNPCHFKTRERLAKEFIERMEKTDNTLLYIVEMVYNLENFKLTQSENERHLQIRSYNSPIWSKENMVNMGIDILLPSNWKAVAWIDADIEFSNKHWAKEALSVLKEKYDIVQLFAQCVDMDKDENPMRIFNSFGRQYVKNEHSTFWHPGYAWAMNRVAYEVLGGIYDLGILGSGDNIMANSIIGNGLESVHLSNSDGYKKSILEFQNNALFLRLGYVRGTIRHHFHGSKRNRKYSERWKILVKYQFDPFRHLIRNEFGLLIPSPECPPSLLSEIMVYFRVRNEDE